MAELGVDLIKMYGPPPTCCIAVLQKALGEGAGTKDLNMTLINQGVNGGTVTDLVRGFNQSITQYKSIRHTIWSRDVFLLADPSSLGAGGPNQNTPRLQHTKRYSRPCLPPLWPRLYAEPFGLGEKRRPPLVVREKSVCFIKTAVKIIALGL